MSASVGLESDPAPFRDRREAGERLARALSAERTPDGLVVGLARGGVEVAASVADALDLPLDALAVRKVGHPRQPEYALGAVTPGGGRYVRAYDDLSDEEVEAAVSAAIEQADELDRRLHEARPALDPSDRTVILVDDGLATGATMTAAVRWARAAGAARVVVAVPVGSTETVGALIREADDVVCVERPAYLAAVGFWYENFGQVSDERVRELLDGRARARRPELTARSYLPVKRTRTRTPCSSGALHRGHHGSRVGPLFGAERRGTRWSSVGFAGRLRWSGPFSPWSCSFPPRRALRSTATVTTGTTD